MVSYRTYSDKNLRDALIKLKATPRAQDVILIEQIEREIRRRGKDPRNSYYGKDVLGNLVKEMVKQQTGVLKKVG